MNKYIDTDKAIDISARYIESVMKAMGVDYRYGKQDASLLFATEPSIDLADYVPKEFHDKTCEAMAKRHQEEIADILERADADRPQGEWKSVKASIYPYGYDVECSVCGHRMGSSFGYKFCPMCGAQMKGADDEAD